MTVSQISCSPKVSIVIPVYNLEQLVSDSIECCINQTFRDIEIIIVNDGSTDQSHEIITSYQAKDQRIKYIHKQNGGLTLARKTGVQAASGEFVFHLDGDDTIPLDTIGNLHRCAVVQEAEIVAGNITVCKPGEKPKIGRYSNFGAGTGVQFLEYILTNYLHYLWGKLIKRSLYVNHELIMVTEMKVVPAEDQVQMYQLCMFAGKVATVGNNVYDYRINNSSITQRPIANEEYTKQQEHYAYVMNRLLNSFPYNDLVRQQINERILRALYLGLHRTGYYIVDKKQSAAIMRSTIANAVFSRGSLFLKGQYELLARCVASLLYPRMAFKMKGR